MVLQTCQNCPGLECLRKFTGGKSRWWAAIKEQQQLLWFSDGQNPLWHGLHTVDLSQQNVKKKNKWRIKWKKQKTAQREGETITSLRLDLSEEWQGDEWGEKNRGQTFGVKLKQALSFHPTVRKKMYIHFSHFLLWEIFIFFPHIPKWKTPFSAKGRKMSYKHSKTKYTREIQNKQSLKITSLN